MIALDASALLAFLLREEGHEQVLPYLADCCCSSMNQAEVLSRFALLGRDVAALRTALERSSIEFVPFGSEDASECALLLSATRAAGLSLADRACLALAKRRHLPALTADRAWAGLNLSIPIRLIR